MKLVYTKRSVIKMYNGYNAVTSRCVMYGIIKNRLRNKCHLPLEFITGRDLQNKTYRWLAALGNTPL